MKTKAGIYVHIPFCKQACSYCDFHFSTSLKTAEAVTEAILREIQQQPYFEGAPAIQSLYFGGGTPSILPMRQLGAIVNALEKKFGFADLREFTLEANPDDISATNLSLWRSLGVNRFSIGVQSFFERDLRYMNRSHSAGEAADCIKRAQDAGFSDLSIDLIYGTPGLTDAEWLQNLETAAALQVPHLSTYALTVEENTPLWAHIRKGRQAEPREESYERQFAILQDFLDSHGYEAYEISNSALPGHRALHNSAYWYGLPYYGFGPSAHGFDGGRTRYSNVAHNVKYARFGSLDEIRSSEDLTETEQMNEFILTRLRLLEGFRIAEFRERFGPEHTETLLQKTTTPAGEWFIHDVESVRLDKPYRILADGISARLFF